MTSILIFFNMVFSKTAHGMCSLGWSPPYNFRLPLSKKNWPLWVIPYHTILGLIDQIMYSLVYVGAIYVVPIFSVNFKLLHLLLILECKFQFDGFIGGLKCNTQIQIEKHTTQTTQHCDYRNIKAPCT